MSDTYDERKWAIAAAAAKDVIELGKYQLYVAYKSEAEVQVYLTLQLLLLRTMKELSILTLGLKVGKILTHLNPTVHCLTEKSLPMETLRSYLLGD